MPSSVWFVFPGYTIGRGLRFRLRHVAISTSEAQRDGFSTSAIGRYRFHDLQAYPITSWLFWVIRLIPPVSDIRLLQNIAFWPSFVSSSMPALVLLVTSAQILVFVCPVMVCLSPYRLPPNLY